MTGLELGAVIAGQVVVVIMAMVKGTWALRDNTEKITQDFNVKLSNIEQRTDEKIDIVLNRFGETMAAVRTKIIEVELWGRDNYVGKGTFNMVIGEIKASTQRLEDKIDDRFDKVEAKLDKIPHNK